MTDEEIRRVWHNAWVAAWGEGKNRYDRSRIARDAVEPQREEVPMSHYKRD